MVGANDWDERCIFTPMNEYVKRPIQSTDIAYDLWTASVFMHEFEGNVSPASRKRDAVGTVFV